MGSLSNFLKPSQLLTRIAIQRVSNKNWSVCKWPKWQSDSAKLCASFSSNSLNDNNQNKTSTEKWDLYVGLCLERKPVITQGKTAMENKYSKFLAQYELELSKKSDHEIRIEKDEILQSKIKAGEIDQGSVQTAQDFEDTCTTELNEFKLQNRFTEADQTKNNKSLYRALDSDLVLLVQQKLGNDVKWLLPQAKRQNGENLRQVADRILNDMCPNLKAKVLSNAPWGFYKYKYPSGISEFVGAKVFFYKAKVDSEGLRPDVTTNINSKTVEDYLWLKHSELNSKLTQNYYKSISEILVIEN